MIKLKIKCYDNFVNIINDNEKNNLYQQYFQSYESKLQNRNIFNSINHYLQNKYCLTNIINGICLENKEMFEDFISF